MALEVRPGLRRFLVAGGVAGALLLGLVTVRAAAVWAESTGLAGSQPASAEAVAAELAAEVERSAALRAELTTLADRSRELAAALAAAREQIATDAATAATLRAELTAARERIAQLEASLAAGPVNSSAAGRSDDRRGEVEHDGKGKHDDDHDGHEGGGERDDD
ncbi:MAG TPA: hypothetical protein VNO86_03020 [Candidatus Binatia bacterium]|nr:hypothetical protein [Candidatus Binatia bacterium]